MDNTPGVTEEDFKYLQDRYGKLVWTAARSIKGDTYRDYDDFAQEIWAIILGYIPGYLKRLNCASVQELCDKYNNWVKMWIWTNRNNIGGKITERNKKLSFFSIDVIRDLSNIKNLSEEHGNFVHQPTHKDVKDFLDKEQVIDNFDLVCFLNDLSKGKTLKDKILSLSLKNPSIFKQTGQFNVSAISKLLNMPATEVNLAIQEINKEFFNEA